MPIIGLAAGGAALFAGIKLLRRRFPPAVPLVATIGQTGASPAPARIGGIDSPPVPAHTGAAEPLGALRNLVADDEKRKITIIMLTSATAWTHIALGLQIPFALLFINGVGYLVLLTGHYFVPQLAPYRDHTRDALSAYTGTTIVGYFATCSVAGLVGPIGIFNKLIEVGLLGALWFDPGSTTATQDNVITNQLLVQQG